MFSLSKSSTHRFLTLLVLCLLVITSGFSASAGPTTHTVDVLIITGPGGHNLAADNVQKRLKEAGLTYARFDFSSLSAWTFEQTLELLDTHPEQANEFYRDYYAKALVAQSPADLPQGEWHSNDQMMSVLNLVKPRVILSTYAISMETLARLERDAKIANIPVGLIPTDYHPERYWTYLLPKAADMVFAPSSDWRTTSVGYGTPSSKITVTGIPGNPTADVVISEAQAQELWKKLDLDPNVTTVFVSGGSGGVGTYGPMIESIRQEFAKRPGQKLQVVFATGSSQKNFEIVQTARAQMPANLKITALGFTPDLPLYLNNLADFEVTKAGGLSTGQAARARSYRHGRLREGRPLLLTVPSYGIEPGNADYFFNEGMAAPTTIEGLGANIAHMMDHPEIQASMMAKQGKLRADAAPEKIIEWTEARLAEVSTKPAVVTQESPRWISEKLEAAAASGKKPVLVVSDMPDVELRKLAAQRTDSISKAEKRAAEKLAAQKLAELRLKYPRRDVKPGSVPFQIAITVDDLPGGTGGYEPGMRRKTVQRMIEIFQGHGIKNVFGFVNSVNVRDWTEVEAVLQDWRKAGFELGNHTHTHKGASASTPQEFIQEVEATDEFLAAAGIDQHERRMFRFPMLQEGDTPQKREAIRSYFKSHGYRVAPVTVDTEDFKSESIRVSMGDDVVRRAKVVQDGIKRASTNLTNARHQSKEVFGRDINHIMLLHLSQINIDMLDQILGEYERSGAQFVSLDEAMKDPVYAIDHGQSAFDMGTFAEEMAYASGRWTPEEDRQGRLKPQTVQRRIRAVRGVPLMCYDLFKAG